MDDLFTNDDKGEDAITMYGFSSIESRLEKKKQEREAKQKKEKKVASIRLGWVIDELAVRKGEQRDEQLVVILCTVHHVCWNSKSREFNNLPLSHLPSSTAKNSFIQLLFREFHRTFGLQFLND